MVNEKYVTKFKGWKIVKITSGKAKGLFYAKKGDTSFGILGDNSVPSIKADINRREGSTNGHLDKADVAAFCRKHRYQETKKRRRLGELS